MLPLVLGGIAAAVVGYGVKEYCEEGGCPWDETSSPALSTEETVGDVWDAYCQTRTGLYRGVFVDYMQMCTSHIPEEDCPALTPPSSAEFDIEVSADMLDDIKRANDLLQRSEKLLSHTLTALSIGVEDTIPPALSGAMEIMRASGARAIGVDISAVDQIPKLVKRMDALAHASITDDRFERFCNKLEKTISKIHA